MSMLNNLKTDGFAVTEGTEGRNNNGNFRSFSGIKDLKSDRFTFDCWVRDDRKFFNSLSKILIDGKWETQVLLTIEESDIEKINVNAEELCSAILKSIELVDKEHDNFRVELFLRHYGEGVIAFSLMFFRHVVEYPIPASKSVKKYFFRE